MGWLKPADRRPDRPWRPQLTAQERRAGVVFLALYLTVFPFLVGGVVRVLDVHLPLSLSDTQSNAVYYTIILLVLLAVFWDFLRNAGAIFRGNLRPSLVAFGAGFFAALGLTALAGLIPLPVENPAVVTYKARIFVAPAATWAVAGLLRPAVEEILYRGFLFGAVRRGSRVWAYVLSAGLFALSAVWQYALLEGNGAYLLLMVQYLPLGAVLCWSYDVSGSVYVPMALRVAAQTMFLVFAALSPVQVPPMGL